MGRQDMSAEPLRGLHILVVDDDGSARELVRAMLAHCGALVTASDSSDAAWLSLSRVVPEVIVCALNLGTGRDAYEFVHRLRTAGMPGAAHIPVVAILRDREHRALSEALEAGFAGYVKAPFDPRQLCAVIADVADAYPRERRPE